MAFWQRWWFLSQVWHLHLNPRSLPRRWECCQVLCSSLTYPLPWRHSLAFPLWKPIQQRVPNRWCWCKWFSVAKSLQRTWAPRTLGQYSLWRLSSCRSRKYKLLNITRTFLQPFTDEGYETFELKVSDLVSRNTAAVSNKKVYENLDWNSWAKQSYDYAITLYDGKKYLLKLTQIVAGITENEAPSQDYIDNGILIAESQIMVGGYRLAYVLNYIFEDSEDELASAIASLLSSFLQWNIWIITVLITHFCNK